MIDPITGVNSPLPQVPQGGVWTIRWSGTTAFPGEDSLLRMKIGTTTKRYRYGQVQIKLIPGGLTSAAIIVTNTLRLHDEYLRGIGEVPSSWPSAALEAQVIAARTFGLAKKIIYVKFVIAIYILQFKIKILLVGPKRLKRFMVKNGSRRLP